MHFILLERERKRERKRKSIKERQGVLVDRISLPFCERFISVASVYSVCGYRKILDTGINTRKNISKGTQCEVTSHWNQGFLLVPNTSQVFSATPSLELAE